ncbi:GNAT family N-acetyltransferase [Bacteriovorax sp. PP10]|uniref:GNAT family N-acetyltransferase n=1 Tax=Bacteriovorax antarcticus TaxID=3088717 RepID=A0ABU5W448_9BACT|nr:GNAT family N-acetyltransferase [Bacteriovorax sp. PP10]MEA9358575.1 GNAT family N-acetyltransferase [Bacteriovorax sp. PP10]
MSQKYIVIDKTSALEADVLFVLKDLDLKHFPTPWDSASWDQVFSEGAERFILVDQRDGLIPGFVLFDLNVVDSFAHLLKILVNPDNRGFKIGKNLLNEAIRVLKERGIRTFFLEVEEENIVARNLYESMGLKVIHKKKHFYSNGGTAIIMTLEV